MVFYSSNHSTITISVFILVRHYIVFVETLYPFGLSLTSLILIKIKIIDAILPQKHDNVTPGRAI